MADHIYDLIIIGAGPAGYTAALRAAAMGLYSCQGASAGDGSLPGYVESIPVWHRGGEGQL